MSKHELFDGAFKSINELSTTIAKYEAENMKLRMLIEGHKVCSDEEADAHDCPLYDGREPYRCAKERLMQELGIGE